MPTAICDACGLEYEYTNARVDRCPICAPKDKPSSEPEYFNQDWESELASGDADEAEQAADE